MRKHDFPNDLFLPWSVSEWNGKRQVLRKGATINAAGQIVGTRFQVDPDPKKDRSRVRETQHDLTRLIGGVRALRDTPGLENAVLAPGPLLRPRVLDHSGRRALFAVECAPKARLANDSQASKVCHCRLTRAIRLTAHRVSQPEAPFDPATGLAGLQAWAGSVVLKRTRDNRWPWVLLLPFLLLLLLIPWPNWSPTFMGARVEDNLILIIDASGSMSEFELAVVTAVDQTLAQMEDRPFSGLLPVRFDVVTNDGQALFGELAMVNDVTRQTVRKRLPDLWSKGTSSSVRSGLQRAAEYVREVGEDTTIIFISDGEDSATFELYDQRESVVKWFGGEDIDVRVQSDIFSDSRRSVDNYLKTLINLSDYLTDPDNYIEADDQNSTRHRGQGHQRLADRLS